MGLVLVIRRRLWSVGTLRAIVNDGFRSTGRDPGDLATADRVHRRVFADWIRRRFPL